MSTHRPPGRRAVTAAWAATVPLAAVAAARLARFDRHPVLSVANAATHFVYLPAYAAVAVGVARRRPALSAVSTGLVAAHLAWTLPEVRRRGAGAADPSSPGTRLRVVSANVRSHSPDSTPLGRELASTGADLLLLQELSAEHLMMIKSAGALEPFAHSYVDERAGSFGAGIWSRYPLVEAETWEPGDLPMARATLDVAGTAVRVFNVHTRAPMRRRWVPVWKRQLRELRRAVLASDGPVIVAGDFNATWGHRPFRELLTAGLRDCHVEVGRGLVGTTWPCNLRPLPPMFRLDHVLISDDLGVLDAAEGSGETSDHRPVIADLLVRPPEGTPPPPVSAASGSPPAGN